MYRQLIAACALFGLCGCESLATSAPSVTLHNNVAGQNVPVQGESLTWALEDLKPQEGTVLTDGTQVPFSIDVRLSGPVGNDKYTVEFATSHEKSHPFVVQTVGEAGEIDYSSTTTWFTRVYGTGETVTAALYDIDQTVSGRTVTKTLLKQVTRNYTIICDEREFVVILEIKKIFGLCTSGQDTVRSPPASVF